MIWKSESLNCTLLQKGREQIKPINARQGSNFFLEKEDKDENEKQKQKQEKKNKRWSGAKEVKNFK